MHCGNVKFNQYNIIKVWDSYWVCYSPLDVWIENSLVIVGLLNLSH